MANQAISAPVGPWEDKRSKNVRTDVETVQRLLKKASKALKDKSVNPGTIDGEIAKRAANSSTIRAIKRFQRYFLARPDGRVDPLPNGRTLKELLRLDVAGGQPTGWMSLANGQKGVKEIAGSKATPSIVMYLSSCKTTKHFKRSYQLSDETAWCAAFVNWVLKKSGLPTLDTPWAPSWKSYGYELAIPLYGAVTVIKGGGSSGHHVAFYVKSSGQMVTLLGGTQGKAKQDRVCELDYPSSKVLAYRWPRPIIIGVPMRTGRSSHALA